MTVAALFCRFDTVYRLFPGVDVFDMERDALNWSGGCSVIAHPPCRLWSRLAHMSTAPETERELARWAVQQVRRWGGVLEHPAWSTLWVYQGLPLPGKRDSFGGWTLPVVQFWWGHEAMKSTFLYIVGVEPRNIPVMPLVLGEAPRVCGTSGRRRDGSRQSRRPELTKAAREATPYAFARWLVELAGLCNTGQSPMGGTFTSSDGSNRALLS